jgi:hypothetical protein
MIEEPCSIYAPRSEPEIILNQETEAVLILSHPPLDPLLSTWIILIIEDSRILLSCIHLGIAVITHFQLILVQLVREDQPILVKPIVWVMGLNPSAQHWNTLPLFWEWIIFVVLSQGSQQQADLLMFDKLFQLSLHDISDILLGFLPQTAEQLAYIRWSEPLLGVIFIIVEILIIILAIRRCLVIWGCLLRHCLAFLNIKCIIQIVNFDLLSGTVFQFWANSLLGKELKIDLDWQYCQVRIL